MTDRDEPKPDEAWYRDGLNFTCTQCGKCCTGDPGYVWVDDAEVAALAAARGERVPEFVALYTKNAKGRRTLREKPDGDCVFYDRKKGCTVHRVRPRQCRTWPFWESNLATPEAWQQAVEVCPGSGVGQLISVEEITARLKVIKM